MPEFECRVEALIADHLEKWQTGWSMGSLGAIAEFHQDRGEPTLEDSATGHARATARGAIAFNPERLGELVSVAYETLSPNPHRWNHAVALCLPQADAAGAQRSVLTELGPDDGAILAHNRDHLLFDMGLSLKQCDFCVRTNDPALIETLRAAAGKSLFEQDNPAMPAILRAHPHRVAITHAGRAEVFQKIGGPDTGGVSPPGPHTHVLPKLMQTGRTHTANTPIPEGLIPVAFLHPGNPVMRPLGGDRPFDTALFDEFQKLMEDFGLKELVRVKRETMEALAARVTVDAYAPPTGRYERTALRVALRQQARLASYRQNHELVSSIRKWQAVHDRTGMHEGDAEEEAPGH